MNKPNKSNYFLSSIYFFSITAAPLFLGSYLVLKFLNPQSSGTARWINGVGFIFFTIVSVMMSGRGGLSGKKQFIFTHVLYFLILSTSLVAAEMLCRCFVPAWPSLGLHGVDMKLMAKKNIDYLGRPASELGFNSWGQRDKERSLYPSSNKKRIAFIGDSFLEHSSTKPLSLLVEDRLSEKRCEIINLGVSSSGPEDYYYRIKNIALKLGVTDCYVFIYEGNDLLNTKENRLFSFLGFAATYPKDSLLETLGLLALNHLMTNSFRPLMSEWAKSGIAAKNELDLGQIFKNVSSQRSLISALAALGGSTQNQMKLARELLTKDLSLFYRMLQSPDEGRFRSYYLQYALNSILDERFGVTLNEVFAFSWIQEIKKVCKEKKVGLTVIIIPEPFSVDPRFDQLWNPLTDMGHARRHFRRASERLAVRCLSQNIRCIYLAGFLKGIPGTYLNLDGHWSPKGSEAVSAIIASAIEPSLL